jgi:hypothetical protein
MPAVRTLECDLKTEVDFVPRGADFEMRLENRSQLCAARSGLWDATWKPKSTLSRAKRTLRCDLKTKVDFSCRIERTLICDFRSRLWDAARSGLWDATTIVDFVPRGVDLRCKKWKSIFRKAKANEKSEKTTSFAAGAGLRLRPKSACATGVGLDATVSVDLCHRSGLGCDH